VLAEAAPPEVVLLLGGISVPLQPTVCRLGRGQPAVEAWADEVYDGYAARPQDPRDLLLRAGVGSRAGVPKAHHSIKRTVSKRQLIDAGPGERQTVRNLLP
jgi:hypothetical protein